MVQRRATRYLGSTHQYERSSSSRSAQLHRTHLHLRQRSIGGNCEDAQFGVQSDGRRPEYGNWCVANWPPIDSALGAVRVKALVLQLIVAAAGIGLGFGGWLVASSPHEHRVFLYLVLTGAISAFLAFLPFRRKVSPAKSQKPLTWPAAVGGALGMPLIAVLSLLFHVPKSLLYASLFGFCAGLCIAVCSLPYYWPLASKLVLRLRGAQQVATGEGSAAPWQSRD